MEVIDNTIMLGKAVVAGVLLIIAMCSSACVSPIAHVGVGEKTLGAYYAGEIALAKEKRKNDR